MTLSDVYNSKTAELVAYYNAHAAKPVTKFADRQTAEKRVIELIKAQPKPVVAWSPDAPKAKKASKPDVLNDAMNAPKNKCNCCGRSNVNSSRYATGLGLCDYCYEESGLENSLADGHMTQEEYDLAIVELKKQYKRDRKNGMTDEVRAQMSKMQAVSWEDPEVRAARAERSAVVVDDTQYGSVRKAFAALNLPMAQHIKFRMRLKEEGLIEDAYGKRWEVIPLNY
jgi:hypothetical protein